jgi:nucleoid-associated protein YgaU
MEKANQPQNNKPSKPQNEKKSYGFDPKRSGQVKKYTVKAGDTLSTIAKKFYGDDSEYTRIYEANKDLIGSDPNKIQVGQELTIPNK